MEEEWRKIEGYDNYSISNLGQVRNDKTKIIRKLCVNPQGYYKINLSKNYVSKTISIHRLVGEAFIPNPENLPQIHHIDGNRLNNNVNNLMWVSNVENCQSTNRNTNNGCLHKYKKKDIDYYSAKIVIYGKPYRKYSKDREICEEWLKNRRYEIENGLEITKDKKY